jgi:hypothetical protein
MYEQQKAIYDVIDLALCTDEPLFIGRNGSTELGLQLGIPQQPQHIVNAGIWPSPIGFAEAAAEATRATDILAAGWYQPYAAAEASFLQGTQSLKVDLPALEPYYAPEHLQWTRLLADQRVAVVSPFAESIQQQIKKPIWPNGLLPQSIDWQTIRTGFPPLIAPNGPCAWPVASWQKAVDLLVRQVEAAKVRVVLLGCGGLGMLVAHRLKQSGHICIVLGGALQILFGIKGRRWLKEPVAANFNEHWIFPLEQPSGAAIIEGGCYW